MIAPTDVVAKITALPLGTFTGTAEGRKYVATRSAFSAGRAIKLVAEEPGGSDYISMNLYLLQTGARIYPCEMPVEKVIRFVRALNATETLA